MGFYLKCRHVRLGASFAILSLGWGGGGCSFFQYADDTVLFIEHDLKKVVNIKIKI
jgi:hypothetical protein